MKNKIFSLVVLVAAALALTSCFNDDKEENNGIRYTDTAITSFGISSLKVVRDTVSKSGADSTYLKSVSTAAYKFYIDQAQGLIYNPDSLPYGAKTDKALVKFSIKNAGTVLIKSVTEQTFGYLSDKDSLDFSIPRTVRVYSQDGTIYRDYTVTVNVHKQRGDVFNWNQLNTNAELAELTAKKAVANDGKMFVFGTKNGRTYGYSTSESDGNTWMQLSETFSQEAYKGVVASNGYLYLADNGTVKRSADGQSWETMGTAAVKQIVAASKTELYALSGSNTLMASKDNGATWNAEKLDDAASKLPTENISYTVRILPTNNNIQRVMLVGKSASSGTAVAWTKLVDITGANTYVWNYVDGSDSYQLPLLTDLTVIDYDGKALALGVKNGAFGKIMASIDGGITWKTSTDYAYPTGAVPSGAFTAAVDGGKFIWIVSGGQVWRGRINSLGWSKDKKTFTE